MKTDPDSGPRGAAAFTLIELLVSMVVLVALAALGVQLINNTTAVTGRSSRLMDADSQSRLVFDRMTADFARLNRLGGMDSFFLKMDGGGSADPNDKMYFHGSGTGFYSATGTYTAQDNSGCSLIGYRVATPVASQPKSLQLERLGKTLTWTGGFSAATGTAAGSTGTPGSPLFLTFPPGSCVPYAASTLLGAYSKLVGTNPPTYSNGSDPDYHVLGEQVFRMEFCFLLRDGSLSNRPVRERTAAPLLGLPKWRVIQGVPTMSVDSSQGYTAGPPGSGAASLWFDDTAGAKRAYRCASADIGAAVWVPGGLEGVSAILVAIATLDNSARLQAPDTTRIAQVLLDPTDKELALTPPATMAVTWNKAMRAPNFAASAGISPSLVPAIRVYQRFIYLNQ